MTVSLVRPDELAMFEGAKRRRRRGGVIAVRAALAWIGAIVVLALCASWLPIDSYASPENEPLLRPFRSASELLGTDNLGRSLLSRVLFGARVSLLVSLGATALAFVVGTTLGVVGGYFGGLVDDASDVVTTALMAFPPLILLVALASVLRPGLGTLVIALGVIATPLFARVARANALVVAKRDFVQASRSMGAGHLRVLVRDVLPNVLLPVLSYGVVVLGALMVAEGSLSFLGLGVPPPTPSWGVMINAGREDLSSDPHLVLVPGACFVLTVLSLNVIGDRLRRRLASGGHS